MLRSVALYADTHPNSCNKELYRLRIIWYKRTSRFCLRSPRAPTGRQQRVLGATEADAQPFRSMLVAMVYIRKVRMGVRHRLVPM